MDGNSISEETVLSTDNAATTVSATDERRTPPFLHGARAYLSGPMGFVASRSDEKNDGWRNRLSQFLKARGVTVFDPWNKPTVRGLKGYGVENVDMIKKQWSFEPGEQGDEARAKCAEQFSSTVRIDLRMVDTSDFTIAYCPTNIYSVGTVHEIIRSREQHKPVLLVSPHIDFPVLDSLRKHLQKKNDDEGSELLSKLEKEASIKPNLDAIPSMWYMPLIDGSTFFDGFGFQQYFEEFGWEKGIIDELEERHPPKMPLLPYLQKLCESHPKRWDTKSKKYVESDDWLLW